MLLKVEIECGSCSRQVPRSEKAEKCRGTPAAVSSSLFVSVHQWPCPWWTPGLLAHVVVVSPFHEKMDRRLTRISFVRNEGRRNRGQGRRNNPVKSRVDLESHVPLVSMVQDMANLEEMWTVDSGCATAWESTIAVDC